MDERDLVIVGAIARDPRVSYGDVGARVGLSANAVKARVRKLEAEGVLLGFVAEPRPALLGLSEAWLVFQGVDDLDDREDELLASLPDVPGVASVETGLEHTVVVRALHRDEPDLDRVERAASSLIGKPPALRWLAKVPDRLPSWEPNDWRTSRALLADPRARLSDLAQRSGLSFKTIQRRSRALLSSGEVHVDAVLCGAAAQGTTLARLLVVGPHERPAGAVLTTRTDTPVAAYDLVAPSVQEARAVAKRARQAGAEHALLLIGQRRRSTVWLDEAMSAAARGAPAKPALAPLPRAR